MRVALYARVSTKQHGQDVETQLQALRAWAKQRKAKIVDEYADRGWSGSKERRPELDRLMADAKHKRFDGVLVARFDRFARSVKHLIQALDDFKSWGVDFVSLTESVDTSTPMGKMVFTVLAAVAELERALIRERVQMGVDRARRDGKRLGRPRKYKGSEEAIIAEAHKRKNIKAVARDWQIPRSTLRSILARAERSATQLRPGAHRGQKQTPGRAGRRLQSGSREKHKGETR